MNTNDIKLPPLPTGYKSYEFPDGGYDGDEMQAYTLSAIEPYAKRIAELEAQIEAYQQGGNAKQRYDEIMKDDTEEPDPIERLRFYCSLAMSGQDWLDVEPFFDAIIADRQRRGEPVLVGWTVSTTGGGILHASKYTEYEANRSGYSLPVYRLTSPQTAEPDLAKCAECGAEMIHVRPGKWQHPDCSQSPQHAEPIVSDVEAIVRLLESREWAEHVATTPLGQRLETAVTALVGADPQPSEPVSKTDWSNELSSWDDEDFIRIFYFHPDLANRLRKVLTEPVVADASVKVVDKSSVPSDSECFTLYRKHVDQFGNCNVPAFAHALLTRYGQQAQIDDSVFKGNSLVGEWICDADAPTPEEEAEWKRIEDAKEKNTNDKDYSF